MRPLLRDDRVEPLVMRLGRHGLSTSWIEKATPTATTVFCRRNASSELS